ncbi:hypothetical protein W97_03205 [Coniosporium apollinis CBS 100218]|uniref:Uncharacterized protein n=1 Tax=Coniosporium apollinis (strain CBS 100218) TaxID=1168221 RepID=R7YPY0_CONA1|nr:uncharacterized protein W97_03205 [Coniosporium apollinis CBS 100218]EON63975.1 hypothetical protein W97_03205 [Coniosporium apollinis CBS 100218]
MESPLEQPSSSPDTHGLIFPTVHVNDIVEHLASAEASPTASTRLPSDQTPTASAMRGTQPHSTEAPSSLEESSYEILGDSQYLTSDDEGNTESLASNEVQTPDDVSSVADTEDYGEDRPATPPVDEGDQVEEPEFQPSIHLARDGAVSDSGMTARPNAQLSTSSIPFADSVESLKGGYIEVTQTIRNIQESDIPRLFPSSDWHDAVLTVKQTLAPKPLKLDGPFRVLFIGDQSHWAKEEIIHKVASALAVTANFRMQAHPPSRGLSRYSVIPISGFGETDSPPEVQLIDSTGIELVVGECFGIVDVLDYPPTLIIDGKHVKLSSLSPQHLPGWNLIVFFHHADEAKHKAQSEEAWPALLQSHFQKLDACTLNISMTPLFDGWSNLNHTHASDMKLCVEKRDSGAGVPTVLKEMPVDLKTFLDVDSAQLNRHIAYVTGLYDDSDETPRNENTLKIRLLDGFKGFLKKQDKAVDYTADLLIRLGITRILTTLFLVFLLFWTPSLMQYYGVSHSNATASTTAVQSAMSSQNAALSSALAELVGTTPIASVKAISDAPATSSVTSRKQQASTSIPAALRTTTAPSKPESTPEHHPLSPHANDSEDFKAHIIGDHHFALTPPKDFARLKKQPDVIVRVFRGDQPLAPRLEKLVEGVYIVAIDRAEAYGTLDVTIIAEFVTKSKRQRWHDQSLRLDFGSPWLKSHLWAAAPAKAVEYLRGLGERYELRLPDIAAANGRMAGLRYRAALSANKASQSAAQLAEKAACAGESVKQKSREAVQSINNGIDELYDVATHYLNTAATKFSPSTLWKQAPSLHAPDAVGKAQKNAKALLGKFKPAKPQRGPQVLNGKPVNMNDLRVRETLRGFMDNGARKLWRQGTEQVRVEYHDCMDV